MVLPSPRTTAILMVAAMLIGATVNFALGEYSEADRLSSGALFLVVGFVIGKAHGTR